MIKYLVLGITFAVAAGVQPGPLQSFLISQGIKHGWRKTLPAAFAPLITDGPIILLVLFILNKAPAWFINVLQFIGGMFLLYLALKSLRSNRKIEFSSLTEKKEKSILLSAVAINFLNPSPYLNWSIILGPILIKGWNESINNGISLLFGFYSIIVLMSIIIIILSSSTRNLHPAIPKVLFFIASIALGGFGIYQLFSSISYFLVIF